MLPKMGEWLNTREAAAKLGVSEASVRRWSDEGVLPVRRVGKRRERRFRVEDVDEFESPRRAAGRVPAVAATVTLAGTPVEVYTHLAAFYASAAGMLRITLPFLAEGLRTGDPCFLLAAGEVLAAYRQALGRLPGVDIDNLVVADGPGRTVVQGLEFWEQALWQAVANGPRVIRIVGEMVSERDQFASEAEMLDYEVALNQTFKRFPCVVVCQYDVRRFSGNAVLAALRAHPDLYKLPLGLFLN
jgi:excisionase family DNA binding protein